MHLRPLLSLSLLLLHLKASYLVSLTKSRRLPQRNNHQNISILLDSLLKGYDNSVRPDFGGKGNRFFNFIINRLHYVILNYFDAHKFRIKYILLRIK